MGWVLDGMPVSVAQARLLETALGGAALGGADSPDKDKKKKKTPSLALEPNAPKDPPPPAPVLDLVLLLDVSDDQILKRAARQACRWQLGAMIWLFECECVGQRLRWCFCR